MNVKEIKELETSEIESKVRELKQDLCALRFQHATGQLENPNELKSVRKTIARMLTILEQRKAQ
jgi:large subunit ribosomal protein L29